MTLWFVDRVRISSPSGGYLPRTNRCDSQEILKEPAALAATPISHIAEEPTDPISPRTIANLLWVAVLRKKGITGPKAPHLRCSSESNTSLWRRCCASDNKWCNNAGHMILELACFNLTVNHNQEGNEGVNIWAARCAPAGESGGGRKPF